MAWHHYEGSHVPSTSPCISSPIILGMRKYVYGENPGTIALDRMAATFGGATNAPGIASDTVLQCSQRSEACVEEICRTP
jgi:hypothetical protein